MRLIGLTTDAGNGWLPWVTDPHERDKLIARLTPLIDGERYVGVFIAAGCGKIPPRACGHNRDGDTLYTWWAGPDDNRMVDGVYDIASRWPIVTQIGFPTTALHGLDALWDDAERLARLNHDHAKHAISFDVSGSNLAKMVSVCVDLVELAGCEARYESRPLSEPVYPSAKYVCMAARARAIMQAGRSLDGDIIVYTGGTGTKNSYIEPEAMVYANRGHLVVEPLSNIKGGG